MSPEEQDALTAGWEQTPGAKFYNQERCPIDFRLDEDGNFTASDLPAGQYRVVVATRTGAPVKSRMVSRGTGKLFVPVLPGGRSDEVLDMGEVKVYYTAPLAPGPICAAPPLPTHSRRRSVRSEDAEPRRFGDGELKYSAQRGFDS